MPTATTAVSSPPPLPAAANGGTAAFGPTRAATLNNEIVTVDPGHNGGNFADPSYIDHSIFNGRGPEACDTTGTETANGYTEALFT